MSNPWLDIPEADYVGHMSSSPAVGQRPVLGRLLGEALETVQPDVVLVLGCSTGNGLEHVNPAVTSRVVVVDVNPKYLLHLRERFPNPAFKLDVRPRDVTDIELEREAYDLVHAGPIFEYIAWPVLLPRVAMALRPGGDTDNLHQLATLASLFRFVEPTALVDAARGEGLNVNARRTEALPAGKSFEVLRFMKHAV